MNCQAFGERCDHRYSSQRSSIGAVGVRLCSSAQPRMPLEFRKFKLPSFARGTGQPLTAAWLCFMLKFACQAPIAANARVRHSCYIEIKYWT